MKPIHEANLLKVADLLDSLKPEEFNYADQVTETSCDTTTTGICGTCCCAWGWVPRLFPNLAHWSKDGAGTIFVASSDPALAGYGDSIIDHTLALSKKLFGIKMNEFDDDKDEWLQVFQPNFISKWAKDGCSPASDATASEVADHIRRFIAFKKGTL